MYSFCNDYGEGAHPDILALLRETNGAQAPGYGEDEYCAEAKRLIGQEIGNMQAAIHFVSGGTQANLLAISAALRPHEAVLAAESGHINVHEAGAIEATGHKVVSVPSPEGKLTPQRIEPLLMAHIDHHMVKPRLLYISNSTELGTVYNAAELAALHAFCQEHGLLLYVDGARLGAALTAPGNQLSMAEMARHTDFFSIGGTKNGALLGEALVIGNPLLQEDFIYQVKLRGALLAKGRLLGLQFLALFRNGLYYENARHANAQGLRLRQGLQERGYRLASASPTNQQFVVLPSALGQLARDKYLCELWGEEPEGLTVRFVTSWATPPQAVDELLLDFDQAL